MTKPAGTEIRIAAGTSIFNHLTGRFHLPTYSPHLNLAETVWRKLKYEWLSASDYSSKEHLRNAVRQA